MKLALYTLPYELHGELKKINHLFEQGLDCLHIRKPEFSILDMKRMLNGINENYHDRIVLHSSFALALKFDVKGIHIPNDDFVHVLQAKFLKSMKPKLQVSTTTNQTKGLKTASSIFDYVMLGPLFIKYSETNIRKKFEQLELRNAVVNATKEVYAIGGIDLQNFEGLQKIGFAGVALQTSVWKSENVYNSFGAFQMSLASQAQEPADQGSIKLVV